MLALTDMVHLLADELARLGARRLALAPRLSRSLESLLFRQESSSIASGKIWRHPPDAGPLEGAWGPGPRAGAERAAEADGAARPHRAAAGWADPSEAVKQVPAAALRSNASSRARAPSTALETLSESFLPILDADVAVLLRTMSTAEIRPECFGAVPHDSASAMRAHRRQDVDRTFKAIEHVAPSRHEDLKGLIVAVAAAFAAIQGRRPRFARQWLQIRGRIRIAAEILQVCRLRWSRDSRDRRVRSP